MENAIEIELGPRVNFAHPEAICRTENFERQRVRMTFAYVVEGRTLRFGVSVCAPQDQFCRATGRERALERLQTEPVVLTYTSSSLATGTPIEDIGQYIALAVAIGLDFPGASQRWASIERWN